LALGVPQFDVGGGVSKRSAGGVDFVTLRPECGGDAEGGDGLEDDGDRAVIQRGDEIPGLRRAGARVGDGEVLGARCVGDGERAGRVGHDLGGGAVLDLSLIHI
jgi:hypothetical protein